MRVEYSAELPTVEGLVMPTSGLLAVRCPLCQGVHFHAATSGKVLKSFCADETKRGAYRIVELRNATPSEATVIRRAARQASTAMHRKVS